MKKVMRAELGAAAELTDRFESFTTFTLHNGFLLWQKPLVWVAPLVLQNQNAEGDNKKRVYTFLFICSPSAL